MLTRRTFFRNTALMAAFPSSAFMLTGCTEPDWVKTAIADLPAIEGVISSILSIAAVVDPVLLPASIAVNIATYGGAVNTGLGLLNTFITAWDKDPSASVLQKINTEVAAIQQNLTNLLNVSHIKDTDLQSTIQTGVGLAMATLASIVALLPSAKKSLAGKSVKTSNAHIKLLTAKEIKAHYNGVASSAGYGAYAVQ